MILLLYQLSYAAERGPSRRDGERGTVGTAAGEVKATGADPRRADPLRSRSPRGTVQGLQDDDGIESPKFSVGATQPGTDEPVWNSDWCAAA